MDNREHLYHALCVGGPLDGLSYTARHVSFVAAIKPTFAPMVAIDDSNAEPVTVQMFEYRLMTVHGFSVWAHPSDRPETVIARLLGGYRRPRATLQEAHGER